MRNDKEDENEIRQYRITLILTIVNIMIISVVAIKAVLLRLTYEKIEINYPRVLADNWMFGPILNFSLVNKKNKKDLPSISSYPDRYLFNDRLDLFCSADEVNALINEEFPAMENLCLCKMDITYIGRCSNSQLKKGCQTITKQNGIDIDLWGDFAICLNRMKKNYLDLALEGNIVPPDSTCEGDSKLCGVLDTLNNKLCVEANQACPLNFIKVVDNESEIQDIGFKYRKLEFKTPEGKKSLLFSNEYTNGTIISEFKIMNHLPCSYVTDNKIKFQPNGFNCTNKVEGYPSLYDEKYILFDRMSIKHIASSNGFLDNLKKYPFYKSEEDKEVYLYMKQYLGINQTNAIQILEGKMNSLSPKSQQEDNILLETFPEDFKGYTLSEIIRDLKISLYHLLNLRDFDEDFQNSRILIFSPTTIFLYGLIILCLIIKLFIYLALDERKIKTYLTSIVWLCAGVLMIIGLISIINIDKMRKYYIWLTVNKYSLDQINNILIHDFDSKLKKLYDMGLTYSILCGIVCFIGIIIFVIFKNSHKEDSYEEALYRLIRENEDDKTIDYGTDRSAVKRGSENDMSMKGY